MQNEGVGEKFMRIVAVNRSQRDSFGAMCLDGEIILH